MALEGLKTLVVDDHPTNRLLLTEMLTGWGATVTEAEDGPSALSELLEASGKAQPYRLMLLDFRMPGMSGLEVAEQIQNNRSLGDMTIMILTSDYDSGKISRSQELGIASISRSPSGGPNY